MQAQTTTTTFVSLLLLSLLATRATSMPQQPLQLLPVVEELTPPPSSASSPSLQSVEHLASVAPVEVLANAVAVENAVSGAVDVGVDVDNVAAAADVAMPLSPDELAQRAPSCQPIGSSCYSSGECCNGRCLTYAHKCVS